MVLPPIILLAGTYQNEESKTSCKNCNANTKSEVAGSSACDNCGIGESSESGSVKCQPCGAGTFGDGCQLCPIGYKRHGTDPDVTQCRLCELGETTSITGAATCEKCSLGKFGSKNGDCTDCSVGQYQDGKGATSCKKCDADTYLNKTGKSSKADCVLCESQKSTNQTKGNVHASTCLCRKKDYYQDDTGKCIKCPNGADCSRKDGIELSELSAMPTYWRPNTTSTTFLECKKNPSRCCPTDSKNGVSICSNANLTSGGTDVQCLPGYSGPLCYACAEKYVFLANECVQCASEVNVGAVLGVYACLCLILFLVVFVVIGRIKSHKKDSDDEEDSSGGSGAVDFYVDLTTIMISFLQVLSAVTTTYSSVDWPESFRSTSEPLGVVNLDISFVLPLADCSLSLDYGTKLLLHIFTPVAIVVAIKCAECAAIQMSRCRRRRRSSGSGTNTKEKEEERTAAQKGMGDRIALTLVLLVYPSMTTRIMQMWRCDEIEGTYYLEADYNVICEGTNVQYSTYSAVAIVALILFGIGIPLTLLIELYRNIGHLHDSNHDQYHMTQFRLGPFYQSFKPKFWWFEVAIIVYKAVMVGVLSVVAPHTPLQLFLALLVCTAYMLLVLKAAPYVTENLDTLSFLCSGKMW